MLLSVTGSQSVFIDILWYEDKGMMLTVLLILLNHSDVPCWLGSLTVITPLTVYLLMTWNAPKWPRVKTHCCSSYLTIPQGHHIALLEEVWSIQDKRYIVTTFLLLIVLQQLLYSRRCSYVLLCSMLQMIRSLQTLHKFLYIGCYSYYLFVYDVISSSYTSDVTSIFVIQDVQPFLYSVCYNCILYLEYYKYFFDF